MADYSVLKAGDLAGDERAIIERWLGRALSKNETISVNAYRPHVAPVGRKRDALRRKIITQAREIGSRARVTEHEVDALVEEAIAKCRGKRE